MRVPPTARRGALAGFALGVTTYALALFLVVLEVGATFGSPIAEVAGGVGSTIVGVDGSPSLPVRAAWLTGAVHFSPPWEATLLVQYVSVDVRVTSLLQYGPLLALVLVGGWLARAAAARSWLEGVDAGGKVLYGYLPAMLLVALLSTWRPAAEPGLAIRLDPLPFAVLAGLLAVFAGAFGGLVVGLRHGRRSVG